MPLYSELAALLDDVAGRVDRWTRQEAWQPEPGSRGAVELANAEVRADGSLWGERPTRTVFQFGQMQMKMVVEYAQSTALLVAAERPPPGIEVETRAALAVVPRKPAVLPEVVLYAPERRVASLGAETQGPVKAGSWREGARRTPAGLEMAR